MTSGRAFRRRTALKGGLAAGVLTAVTPLPAHAGHLRPHIHPTSHWGARPPAEYIVVEDRPPRFIVVHHTVHPGNTDDLSLQRAFEISRAIQNHHMDGRGWIDTGQQFTVSRGGHITEGRHRSLEILDEGERHVLGANVADHNSEVIGIENEGLYTDEDVPDTLWASLADLVTYIAARYHIDTEMIKGHRDFNATQCPGDVLYARLPELRAEVARRLGRPRPLPLPVLDP